MADDQDFIPYKQESDEGFIPYNQGPSESDMVANRPDKTATQPGIPRSLNEMIGEGSEAEAQGNADLGRKYVHAGPIEVGGGLSDIAHGNVAHGIHRVVAGGGITAFPAVASTLPIAAATAPTATLTGMGLGAVGQYAGKRGGEAAGLTPDQSDVAGDVTGFLGGYGGARLGKFGGELATDISNQLKYKPAESIHLPWYLGGGSIARDTPPPPIEELPYEEKAKALMLRGRQQSALDRAARSPEDVANAKLNQKVADISAQVRAGLRPSPEEEMQSVLGKEFTAGEGASKRVPQDIRPPRTPNPTYPPKGAPGARATSIPRGGSITEEPPSPQSPNVLLAPIRKGPFPNNPSGNIQNVPRELLPEIAGRTGDPAAVREFQRTTGRPALFLPESIGSGPRESIPESSMTEMNAFRARPVGQEGIPAGDRPQATMSEEEARGYAKNLEDMTGKPHEVVKVNLNKATGGFRRNQGPRGHEWINFTSDIPESIVEKEK